MVSVCTRVAGIRVRQQRRVERVAANGRVRDHMYTNLRKYLLAQRMQVCQMQQTNRDRPRDMQLQLGYSDA